jgi:hypothetical protein
MSSSLNGDQPYTGVRWSGHLQQWERNDDDSIMMTAQTMATMMICFIMMTSAQWRQTAMKDDDQNGYTDEGWWSKWLQW